MSAPLQTSISHRPIKSLRITATRTPAMRSVLSILQTSEMSLLNPQEVLMHEVPKMW